MLTQYPLAPKVHLRYPLAVQNLLWLLSSSTRFPFNNVLITSALCDPLPRSLLTRPRSRNSTLATAAVAELIHSQDDVGGGMQQLVDFGVGPSGDVWLTNNWEIGAAWQMEAGAWKP